MIKKGYSPEIAPQGDSILDIGSALLNRIALQHQYECYFFIADLHTLTTKPQREAILEMRQYVIDVVLDWLSCGIDPDPTLLHHYSSIWHPETMS